MWQYPSGWLYPGSFTLVRTHNSSVLISALYLAEHERLASTTSSHRAESHEKKRFSKTGYVQSLAQGHKYSHCTCDPEIGQRIEPKTCKSSYQPAKLDREPDPNSCNSSWNPGNWTENLWVPAYFRGSPHHAKANFIYNMNQPCKIFFVI